MNIPFVDLKKNYLENKKEIDQACQKVLSSGNYILGENVAAFEKEFADYLKCQYAVGVASGTDAIILSLKALGITKNDEVIIPANSYPTAFAVAQTASIKLVDIDLKTSNINPEKIGKVITSKTKVILPIHLFGLISPMIKIVAIAKKHHFFVVADASQAHGARLGKQMAGTIGDLGCFSFYPTKNLGACGDAGMVTTNNKIFAQKVRQLRMYGEKKRFESESLGINSRLDEIQAAILRIKLKKLDESNQRRIEIAQIYFEQLKNLSLVLPPQLTDFSHVYHLFAVRTAKKSGLRKFLLKNGILSSVHSGNPTHLVKAFSYLGYKRGDFPNAEKSCRETLFLPLFPEMADKQAYEVCRLVKFFFKR